jgi:hypothetical protein
MGAGARRGGGGVGPGWQRECVAPATWARGEERRMAGGGGLNREEGRRWGEAFRFVLGKGKELAEGKEGGGELGELDSNPREEDSSVAGGGNESMAVG